MNLIPFRSKTIVLLYHRIADEKPDPWSMCVTPEHFEGHLQVLKRFEPIPLSEAAYAKGRLFGGLRVAITFDDGYSDNVNAAAPLLQRYDMPATFFIATGYLGSTREYWWDELERIVFESAAPPQVAENSTRSEIHGFLYEQLRPMTHEVRRRELDRLTANCCGVPAGRIDRRPMGLEQLRSLASNPLFEIGAHTVTHPLLSALSPGEQSREISGSKAFLEGCLDKPVHSFSYPYGGKGHYAPASVTAVRDCGFSRACTTEGHPVKNSDGPFEISRRNVTDMDGEALLRLLAS